MFAQLRIPATTVMLGLLGVAQAQAQEEQHGLLDALAEQSQFTKFSALVEKSAVAERLDHGQDYTVFAPTNEAFAAMPEGTYNSLLEEANLSQLINLVDFHFVEASIETGDIDDSTMLQKAMNGDELRITSGYGRYRVNNIHLHETEIDVENGFIYAIDAVLMPARDYAGN